MKVTLLFLLLFFFGKSIEIIQLLLDHGSDLEYINPSDGSTHLHQINIRNLDDDCKQIFKNLLKAGAKVDALKFDGSTPLLCLSKFYLPNDINTFIEICYCEYS